MGIPEMAEQHWDLNKEFARLLSEKKAAYSEYKEIKKYNTFCIKLIFLVICV